MYRFNTFSPIGIQFEERHNNKIVFNTKSDEFVYHKAPTHESNDFVPKRDNTYVKVTI